MANDPTILMTRCIDGCASREDWAEFEAHASRDPSLWRDLALDYRNQGMLADAVREATLVSDRVDVPVAATSHAPATPHALQYQPELVATGFRARMSRVGSWGGWAAAAALLLAFVGRSPVSGTDHSPDIVSMAGIGPDLSSLTADQARGLYYEKGVRDGRVIRELPKVLLDSRPTIDGEGVEVTYLRQFMERDTVRDIYRFTQDEAGNTTPVRLPVKRPALAPQR